MEPGRVGVIVDTSVVIGGERRGSTVRQILEQLKRDCGELEIGLSVVTIVELTHGIQRAGTEERRQRRQAFVDELIRDVRVHPVTVETARVAGRIEGAQQPVVNVRPQARLSRKLLKRQSRDRKGAGIFGF